MIKALKLSYLLFFAAAAWAAPGDGCTARPVPTISSSDIPTDVCIPNGFSDVGIDYFDDYGWRAFVAIVWPAAAAERGRPDSSKALDSGAPKVFETYKPLWEVFHGDGSAPTAKFAEYDTAENNACKIAPQPGDVLLAASAPWADIGQTTLNGDLTGPVVAQNGRYVRYQTLYNQTAYDFIVSGKLYLRENLPDAKSRSDVPLKSFPNGSIAIKVAWLEMRGFTEQQQSRFYTRIAIIKDPDSGKCTREKVGMVGLHIVQKTPNRPQWIWATFEQVDSVPEKAPDGHTRYTFHDGSGTPMPPENPLYLVPLARQPVKPFNVVRGTPLHPNTVVTNAAYRGLLKGTIWANYQLVMTQWTRVAGNQALPVSEILNGDASNTFPGVIGSFSAFAHPAMETFDQKRVQSGCMNCHNKARVQTDFMWSVINHAYPPILKPEPAMVRSTPAKH